MRVPKQELLVGPSNPTELGEARQMALSHSVSEGWFLGTMGDGGSQPHQIKARMMSLSLDSSDASPGIGKEQLSSSISCGDK